MTKAEEELIAAALSLNGDSEAGAFEILEPYILAVRQERLPEELYQSVLDLEKRYQADVLEYRARLNDFGLNYPQEMLSAALSKARSAVRGSR